MYDPHRGYPSVVPYVRYRDPEAAIAWLSAVLGAREAIRMTLGSGRIGHAELLLGDHVITLGQATGEEDTARGPARVRSMTVVFVPDVDAATERAAELGGTVIDRAADIPWGVRQAIVCDPKATSGNSPPTPARSRSRPGEPPRRVRGSPDEVLATLGR